MTSTAPMSASSEQSVRAEAAFSAVSDFRSRLYTMGAG